MSTIPWEQVRSVVDAALELPPDARTPFLDQACPQLAVRRYVESLIFSFDQAAGFLEEPASVKYSNAMQTKTEDSWIGRRVGAYEIEKVAWGRCIWPRALMSNIRNKSQSKLFASASKMVSRWRDSNRSGRFLQISITLTLPVCSKAAAQIRLSPTL